MSSSRRRRAQLRHVQRLAVRASEPHWLYRDSADEQLKRQLASRSVTYLLGDADLVPFGGFDNSCPAMAQGPTRLARGLAYARYMNEQHEARHETVVVEACGHDDRCMFTSNQALPLLFPRP
jgi:hypothetical protein